jgi:hypothetical protein
MACVRSEVIFAAVAMGDDVVEPAVPRAICAEGAADTVGRLALCTASTPAARAIMRATKSAGDAAEVVAAFCAVVDALAVAAGADAVAGAGAGCGAGVPVLADVAAAEAAEDVAFARTLFSAAPAEGLIDGAFADAILGAVIRAVGAVEAALPVKATATDFKSACESEAASVATDVDFEPCVWAGSSLAELASKILPEISLCCPVCWSAPPDNPSSHCCNRCSRAATWFAAVPGGAFDGGESADLMELTSAVRDAPDGSCDAGSFFATASAI